MSSTDVKACVSCKKPLTKTLRCSRCQSAFYCSRECQLSDWKNGHRQVCRTQLQWLKEAETIDERVLELLHEAGGDNSYDYEESDNESMDREDDWRVIFRQRDAFLNKPGCLNASAIKELKQILIEDTMDATAGALLTLLESESGTILWPWDIGITIGKRIESATRKMQFALVGVVRDGFAKSTPDQVSLLMDLCKQVLEQVLFWGEKFPHNGTSIARLHVHFEMKKFLSQVSAFIWDDIFCSKTFEQNPSLSVNNDGFLPLFRKLAMRDLFEDAEWNMHGEWNVILRRLGVLNSIPADDELNRQTSLLRKAHTSMRFKLMNEDPHLKSLRNGEPAKQCWEYQAKCSAMACCNLETEATPHEYRCEKCWYFHFCSFACQEYSCRLTSLHTDLCQATPPDMAAQTKKEAHAFLGIFDDDGFCSGCGQADPDKVFDKCSRCLRAVYCSQFCQRWHWPSHKATCRKRGASSEKK